jgi:hypothetical protein
MAALHGRFAWPLFMAALLQPAVVRYSAPGMGNCFGPHGKGWGRVGFKQPKQ